MATLITYTEQQEIRPISPNLQGKYDQLAIEVQKRDLESLLGVKLYQDLVNNPTEEKYETLLNGGVFTCDDFEYTQEGLKYVLAYFIYSDYAYESQFKDTFSGVTKKNLQNSNRAEYGEIKTKQKKYRTLAFNAFGIIKLFLDDNTDTYPYWDCETTRKKLTFTAKITKI